MNLQTDAYSCWVAQMEVKYARTQVNKISIFVLQKPVSWDFPVTSEGQANITSGGKLEQHDSTSLLYVENRAGGKAGKIVGLSGKSWKKVAGTWLLISFIPHYGCWGWVLQSKHFREVKPRIPPEHIL